MFNLGRLLVTCGINEKKNLAFQHELFVCIDRYLHQDWGDICEEDKKRNDRAVKTSVGYTLAQYATSLGDIFIRTDVDIEPASDLYTIVMFANEY